MFRAIGWVDSHKARAARGEKTATERPPLSVLDPLPSTDESSACILTVPGQVAAFTRVTSTAQLRTLKRRSLQRHDGHRAMGLVAPAVSPLTLDIPST